MNLQPITSAERLPFRFNCAGCDKHQRSDTAPDARADLDAKAFTFYCGDCVRLLVEHAGRLDARVLSLCHASHPGPCRAKATVLLFAPDGEPNPGGYYCAEHGAAITHEYRTKLREHWAALPLYDRA